MKDLKWKALVALMIVVAGLFVGFSAETLKAQPETIAEYQISPSIAEAQITTNTEGQESPAVYGDIIVWEDIRNGDWDIYLAELTFPPPPESPTEKVEEIISIIEDPSQIPTPDLDGANDKVKENRRNALLNRLQAVILDIQTAEASTDPSVINTAYQSAIDQLNSILDKTDGCSERGTPDTPSTLGETPDWIITCEAQAQIDPLIRELITILEALLVP